MRGPGVLRFQGLKSRRPPGRADASKRGGEFARQKLKSGAVGARRAISKFIGIYDFLFARAGPPAIAIVFRGGPAAPCAAIARPDRPGRGDTGSYVRARGRGDFGDAVGGSVAR